jgi:hypothetical protein
MGPHIGAAHEDAATVGTETSGHDPAANANVEIH